MPCGGEVVACTENDRMYEAKFIVNELKKMHITYLDRVSLKLQRKKDGRIIHFANKNSTDTLYLGSLHCGKIYLSEE